MSKKRSQIPKPTRDAVLKEFHHRCALCGKDQAHLHHIDENPANHDPFNLLPLCPNCHLGDQHDASNAVPLFKLRLFRRYKHRLILTPQFTSLSRRMEFLDSIADDSDVAFLQARVDELLSLVWNLTMGAFFHQELSKLLKPLAYGPDLFVAGGRSDPAAEAGRAAQRREDERKFRQQLRHATPSAHQLIIELLNHQNWGDGLVGRDSNRGPRD